MAPPILLPPDFPKPAIIRPGVLRPSTEDVAKLLAAIPGLPTAVVARRRGILVPASVLLHMDGADASTTFIDEVGHTVTPAGNAQIDTAQSVFGGASGLFDGTGDYLQIVEDAGDLAPGMGDFTIAFRLRLAATGQESKALIGNRRNGAGSAAEFVFKISDVAAAGATDRVALHSGAGTIFEHNANAMVANNWYWWTLCRASGVYYLGLDGTIVRTGAFTNDLSSVEDWFVGGNDVFLAGGGSLNGRFDEVLYVNGQALYIENSAVPPFPYRVD